MAKVVALLGLNHNNYAQKVYAKGPQGVVDPLKLLTRSFY